MFSNQMLDRNDTMKSSGSDWEVKTLDIPKPEHIVVSRDPVLFHVITTWRIIPVRKWLIDHAWFSSPKDRVV